MSGECKSYRLNEPMNWVEFKSMPTDLQACYVKALRNKYNVPDNALAEMFGVNQATVSGYFRQVGLGLGKNGRARTWDEKGFVDWKNRVVTIEVAGYPTTKKEIEDVEKEHTPLTKEDIAKFAGECEKKKYPHGGSYDIPQLVTYRSIVPDNGTLVFAGDARGILRTLGDILRDEHVRLTVQWSVVDKPGDPPVVNLDTEGLKKAAATIDYAILNEQRRKALGTMG